MMINTPWLWAITKLSQRYTNNIFISEQNVLQNRLTMPIRSNRAHMSIYTRLRSLYRHAHTIFYLLRLTQNKTAQEITPSNVPNQ